jgi:mitochondrial enoyl-[acyl-carrier protein] reductase / trans-2-enoyl-CoA reductase
MSQSINAIVYAAHGKPEEVLRLEEQRLAGPGPDEALVRLKAAPINPADLNQIEGKYPIRFPLPATPGFEGAGVIETVGPKVQGCRPGELVILPHNLGTWREAAIVKADNLTVVPQGIEPEQAAMLKINPLTAWRILHDFVKLPPGEWMIQNAANSAVGRAVMAIGRALGLRTVNVVRRAELIPELQAAGGDVVLLDNDDLRDAVPLATGKAPIRLGLNQVGGASALRLAKVVAPEATIVTIGAMSLQPLTLPNGLLIFKNLHFTGFWVNKWYEGASAGERAQAFEKIFELAKQGLLRTPIERAYSLADFQAAVERASAGQRAGKIIFRF